MSFVLEKAHGLLMQLTFEAKSDLILQECIDFQKKEELT